MGWDAWAIDSNDQLVGEFQEPGSDGIRPFVFRNPKVAKAFARALDEVRECAGSADGFLMIGGLDCSACGKMLESATGLSMYPKTPWSADLVKAISKTANWKFWYDPEDAWAYWSARRFLEICGEFYLGISMG